MNWPNSTCLVEVSMRTSTLVGMIEDFFGGKKLIRIDEFSPIYEMC